MGAARQGIKKGEFLFQLESNGNMDANQHYLTDSSAALPNNIRCFGRLVGLKFRKSAGVLLSLSVGGECRNTRERGFEEVVHENAAGQRLPGDRREKEGATRERHRSTLASDHPILAAAPSAAPSLAAGCSATGVVLPHLGMVA